MTRRAIVLLSGGLDSATVAAIAREQGFEILALTFDYGQRHAVELRSAERLAQYLKATEHQILEIDLRRFGGSALTDDVDVPKSRQPHEINRGVPVTYVPARNMVFLSLAVAFAESRACRDIFIGVNAIDFSGYPDCRPQFIEAFEFAANLGTKLGVEDGNLRIHAPLIDMTKAEIIRRAVALGVDLSLTHSCYDPNPEGHACGECDSCQLRRKGFAEAGVHDPTIYAG